MQTRHLVIATAFVASLGLGACSSNPTNAQIGTGAGAVVGGVAGNALHAPPPALQAVPWWATNWAKTGTSAAADSRSNVKA